MKDFIKTYFDLNSPQNMVLVAAICVFLPYQLAAIIMLFIVGKIILKKGMLKSFFERKSNLLAPVFIGITIITAILFKNWLGAFVSVIFFLIIIFGFYVRKIMTHEIFEKMLSFLCGASIFASAVILFEKIIYFSDKTHRCFGDFFPGQTYSKLASFYFSPTYLSSCMVVVVVICAYKVINRKGHLPYYYLTAFLSMLTIYFAGSMFVWVNAFAALAAYLIIIRHRKLIALVFTLVAIAGTVLFFVPDILPRLSEAMLTVDNRLLIWNLSLDSLKISPLFGQGFQTYGHIANGLIAKGVQGVYSAYHAHNIFLEPLLSYGIIGSGILALFVVKFYKDLFSARNKESHIFSIIIAISVGIFIHSLIDMTMLWIQPMIIYCLIFGAVGADERYKKSTSSEVI